MLSNKEKMKIRVLYGVIAIIIVLIIGLAIFAFGMSSGAFGGDSNTTKRVVKSTTTTTTSTTITSETSSFEPYTTTTDFIITAPTTTTTTTTTVKTQTAPVVSTPKTSVKTTAKKTTAKKTTKSTTKSTTKATTTKKTEITTTRALSPHASGFPNAKDDLEWGYLSKINSIRSKNGLVQLKMAKDLRDLAHKAAQKYYEYPSETRNKLIKEYVASQGNYSFKAYIDNNPNALDSISTIVGTSKITTNTSARYAGIALLAYADTNRGITTYSLVIIYQ